MRIAKFDSLERRRCEDIKGIVAPEKKPEKFRIFWETDPRTDTRRQSSRFLISFVRPISSQTMSRWLKKAMQLAGIACHVTVHFTRSASTSAVARSGVSLDAILVAVDWFSLETFKCFYLRSPDKEESARAVSTVLAE